VCEARTCHSSGGKVGRVTYIAVKIYGSFICNLVIRILIEKKLNLGTQSAENFLYPILSVTAS